MQIFKSVPLLLRLFLWRANYLDNNPALLIDYNLRPSNPKTVIEKNHTIEK